ncbi:hypothetical protein F0562_014497 [Nyssa sinensis]|uniref:Uncharacterized protein n=1 Tax=Nyssa sinensis TaxID=561372 RepID=A0A5J4ZT41_9ASTE|nr:hypothetical protein F0562_014497 [Nyssa sinensis]
MRPKMKNINRIRKESPRSRPVAILFSAINLKIRVGLGLSSRPSSRRKRENSALKQNLSPGVPVFICLHIYDAYDRPKKFLNHCKYLLYSIIVGESAVCNPKEIKNFKHFY